MTKNQIDYMVAVETQRWHKATEQENARHNREDERIRDYANSVNMTNAQTNQLLAQETERHNRATEWLTDQYNRSSIALNTAYASKAYSDIMLNQAKAYEALGKGSYYTARGATEAKFGSELARSQILLNKANTAGSYANVDKTNLQSDLLKKDIKHYWSTNVLPAYTRAFSDVGSGVRNFIGAGTDAVKTIAPFFE